MCKGANADFCAGVVRMRTGLPFRSRAALRRILLLDLNYDLFILETKGDAT